MPAENIARYFNEIDTLQYALFDKINDILSLQDVSLGQVETVESKRSVLCQSANKMINKISDILQVIDTKIRQVRPDEATTNLFQEKHELYVEKVQYLKQQLKESQLKAYKTENDLIHKQRLEQYVKTEELGTKDDLFAGRTISPAKADGSVDDQILTQNKNITSSLKLTKQLMTMSVMQTELNIDTIDQQSKDLSNLNDKLIDLESVLLKSRQIVKFIEKQDRHDRRRIYMALGFLLVCCAWVIWRRILKLPVKIMLWTFMRMFGVVSWVASKTPDLKGSASEVSQTSWLTEAASVSESLASEIASLLDDLSEVIQEVSQIEGVEASTVAEVTETVTETTLIAAHKSGDEVLVESGEPYIQDVGEVTFETWEPPHDEL